MTDETPAVQQPPRWRLRGAAWVTLVFLAVYATKQLAPLIVASWNPQLASAMSSLASQSDTIEQLALPLILGYWLGSSEGSALKTRIMARSGSG